MKLIWLISLLFAVLSNCFAQNCETRTISLMDQSLSETSGLLFMNGVFITFNDSGGQPELYEVDTANGSVQRTVTIQNATNVDWEAITADDDYIYVGDIGNNSGTRTNLKLFKISISDYLSSTIVTAQIINFEYSNQTSFVSQPNDTRFDAEAIANVNGEIILFSKNWKGNMTTYYSIPKAPGTYDISPIDSIQMQGKVTDAVFLPAKNQLFLIGYAIDPFIHTVRNMIGTDIKNGLHYSCFLNVANSIQVEGICSDNDRVFYSSEYFSFSSINLEGELGEITYAMSLGVVESATNKIRVKNSISSFQFESDKFKIKKVEVFDSIGKQKRSEKVNSKSYKLIKDQFTNGYYIIQLGLSNNQTERIKVIID
jgi:hypothetical protein